MNEHVEMLLESLDHAIVVCDLSGTVSYANIAAINTLQVESIHLLGKRLNYNRLKSSPILSLNTYENNNEHDLSGLSNAFGQDKHLKGVRLLLQKPDNSSAEFLCSISLTTSPDGSPVNIVLSLEKEVGISNNTTVKNEQEFNEIFVHADIFAAFVDAQGQINYANNKLCEVTGWCWEEIIGKNWFTGFMPTDSLWKMAQAFIESTNQKKNVVVFEGELLTKDGARRPVTFNTIFLRDHNQELVGISISGEDITDKRLAETKIKESESRFRSIFEQSSKATFVCWPGGSTLQCNNAMRELLACSCSTNKCNEKIFSKAFSISNKTRVFEMIKSVERGVISSEELEIGHKDGSKTWVILTTSPINMGGKRLCLGSMQDITGRKQSEQALAVREKEYRTLLQNIPDLIVRYDKDMRRIYVNPAWEEASGLSAKEVVDKNPGKIPKASNPMVYEYVEKIQKVFSTGIPETVDFSWVNARNEKLQLEYVIVPEYDCFGNMASVLCVGHDLTERKNAEERLRDSENRLRLTLEATGIGIWDWDVKNDLWHASPTYYTMLGYNPEEGYADRSEWMRRVHLQDRALVLEKIQNVITRDFESYEYEARMRHADGNYHWMYVKGFGIKRDDDGKVTRMLGIRIDITERKRAEQEQLANLRFFESMDRINRAIQGTSNVEQMMSNVLDEVLSIFDCDRASLLYPCDPETSLWSVPMERTRPEYLRHQTFRNNIPIDYDMARSFRRILDSSDPLGFGPGNKYPLPESVAEKYNFKSFLAMALYPKIGKPWEFGLQQCSYSRTWLPEEERLFREIGRRLEDALTSLLINRDLRKSEQKFRRIFSTAVEGIWILDADHRTSIVNYRVAEILGHSIDEFSDRPMTDFMFEEDIPDHQIKMQNQRQDMPETYECRFRRKDGKTVWAIISAAPDFDDDDHFSGSFVLLTDITERKQVEIERAANLHFFESMDRVNRALVGTSDLDQMMSDVLDVVLSVFDCDRAFLMYPFDPDAPIWAVPMVRTRPEYSDIEALGVEIPIDPDITTSFKFLLNTNGPVRFDPESEYPLPMDVAEKFNFKSFIGMALYPKVGKPWEFGLHQCSYSRVWSDEEAKLFQEIGRRLTDALSSLLIYRNLMESEQRFLDIFDNSLDVLYLLEVTEDMHFRNIEVNPAFERSTGLSREQVIGKLQEEVVPTETADAVNAKYRRCVEAGETIEEEVWLDVPSGKQLYHSTLIPARDETGRIYRIVGITRDITEQALAKEAIEKSEQKYRQLFEESFDGVFITSHEGRLLDANKRAIDILGYNSIDEMLDLDVAQDIWVHSANRELELKRISELGQGEFDTVVKKKDGEEIIVHISLVADRDEAGRVFSYRGIIRDVTEQRRVAEEIRESRKQVLDILESIIDGFFALDDDWRFTYINRRAEQLFGIKRENLLYRNIWQILPQEEAPATFEQFNLARKRVKPLVFEEFIPKIGKWLEFHVHSYEKGLSVYIHDITERKQAEIEQQRLNRELRAIRSCEQALLQAEDEQALLDDICRIVAEEAGYRLAWVGYVEHDEAKTIRPAAWAGLAGDYVENAKLSWAEDDDRGRGPSGTAARSGKTVYVKDYAVDPLVLPWRESALQHGFRSGVALPLKDENNQVFGVFQVYAGNLDAINEEEIRLLEELANDLAFGIIMLRGRAERKKAEEALRISEERYRKAEAMGHVGNWEYNLQTTEYWCSDETKRIFGIDPKQPFFSIGDIAGCISERERIRRAFADLAKEGKPYNVKFAIIPKNSSEPRMIASIAELHRDEYGNPLKIVGIIQDITDLRKTETELLSHLHFLNSMDRINKAMHGTKDLDKMMGNVLDEVLSIFDCDRAYIAYPCDPESPVWSVPMERTKPEFPGIFSQGIEVKMDKNVIDTFKILLHSDTPVRFGPGSGFPLPVGIEDRFDVKSMMAMAIHPKAGKPWQFGLHQCAYSRVWTQDEEKLFNEIGMRIVDGLAILQMHHFYGKGTLSSIIVD